MGVGGVITFLLLRSLGLFFCYLFLCYACRLPHHLARNTSCYAFGRKCYVTLARCRIILHARRHATLARCCIIFTQHVVLRCCWGGWGGWGGWRLGGVGGGGVITFLLLRSLKWPSPAQFLKQLAKLQGKKL